MGCCSEPLLALLSSATVAVVDVILFGLVFCGIVAACIAHVKHRSVIGWFFLGMLLGLIGILIVALLPSAAPGPPRGMRREYCKRCNAMQNVSA